MVVKFYAKFVNKRSIALVRANIVGLTMGFRLNKYPFAVNEQQNVSRPVKKAEEPSIETGFKFIAKILYVRRPLICLSPTVSHGATGNKPMTGTGTDNSTVRYL